MSKKTTTLDDIFNELEVVIRENVATDGYLVPVIIFVSGKRNRSADLLEEDMMNNISKLRKFIKTRVSKKQCNKVFIITEATTTDGKRIAIVYGLSPTESKMWAAEFESNRILGEFYSGAAPYFLSPEDIFDYMNMN